MEKPIRGRKKVNSRLCLGLMIRWGGEERDGLNVDELLPYFGEKINLRVGEGHFSLPEYRQPVKQAIEHLVASYHISRYPQEVSALTETTYFDGVTRKMILKKVALALAAGCTEVAYCPCVKPFAEYQDFIARDRFTIDQWTHVFSDKTRLYRPVAILRTPAAGYGDKDPVKRVRDRQPFPLFSLAGFCATVIRQGKWRDHDNYDVAAITGRSVWDVSLEKYKRQTVVLDGYAVLENAPLIQSLGIRDIQPGEGGQILFKSDFRQDGLLQRKGNIVIIPYLWQDVPDADLHRLLEDIRRVIGPAVKSMRLQGTDGILLVHYRFPDHDAILLVNLTADSQTGELALTPERKRLFSMEGKPMAVHIQLAPDEIQVLMAR